MANFIFGIPNRKGKLDNVRVEDATEADTADAVTLVANKFSSADDRAYAEERLKDAASKLGWHGSVREKAYRDGNPFLLVSRATPSLTPDEADTAFAAIGL